MSLLHLGIRDFRNISEVDLHFLKKGLHIITGENGSGKTNLLESIYYLGRAKSFRIANVEALIRHSTTSFRIVARLLHPLRGEGFVGVERSKQLARWQLYGEKMASIAELAYLMPVRLINSYSQDLIALGPLLRRQYLDWGLFYDTPRFLKQWGDFCNALKQRNRALRSIAQSKKRSLILEHAWTHAFVEYSLMIDEARREYVTRLSPIIQRLAAIFLERFCFDIIYQTGWDEGMTLMEALKKRQGLEGECGYTLCGPHRADLLLLCNGYPAKQILSRGQQKLLVCAMIIAQGLLLRQSRDQSVIYLVDDLPAELDQPRRLAVLHLLAEQQAQVFITAIERQILEPSHFSCSEFPVKMFHVEHGRYITVT